MIRLRQLPVRANVLRSIAAVLVSLFALAGCTQDAQRTTAASGGERETQPAAEHATIDVAVVDRAGYQAAIDRHRGRIVLVDYWATWCDPCRRQFPHTVALWHKHRDRGLDCISLSFDDPNEPEGLREVGKFLTENEATFENLVSKLGSGEAAAEEFDFDGGLPYYVIYDREGKIAKRISPSDPTATFRSEMIDQAVEELLAQKPAP